MSNNYAPTPKVAAGSTSGAAALLLVWILGQAGVDMPPEVAGAAVLVITAGAAWLKSDRTSPGRHEAVR